MGLVARCLLVFPSSTRCATQSTAMIIFKCSTISCAQKPKEFNGDLTQHSWYFSDTLKSLLWWCHMGYGWETLDHWTLSNIGCHSGISELFQETDDQGMVTWTVLNDPPQVPSGVQLTWKCHKFTCRCIPQVPLYKDMHGNFPNILGRFAKTNYIQRCCRINVVKSCLSRYMVSPIKKNTGSVSTIAFWFQLYKSEETQNTGD